MFEILLTNTAFSQLESLRADRSLAARLKAVEKTLELLEQNPRHPGLKTHEFTSLKGPQEEKVFTAYAQQNTPSAYRVFWYYGPGRKQITVIAITPHP
jgi:hypothetical protein